MLFMMACDSSRKGATGRSEAGIATSSIAADITLSMDSSGTDIYSKVVESGEQYFDT